MEIITGEMLDRLSREAADGKRLRLNLNLHQNFRDPCQRLFNAVEPDSYIRPHRHMNPAKWEVFVAVRGRLAVVVFDGSGGISLVTIIAPGGENVAVEIEAGQWHTIVSLEKGSVFFEVKPGPYEPVTDKDWADWAPAENGPGTGRYLTDLKRRLDPHMTPS